MGLHDLRSGAVAPPPAQAPIYTAMISLSPAQAQQKLESYRLHYDGQWLVAFKWDNAVQLLKEIEAVLTTIGKTKIVNFNDHYFFNEQRRISTLLQDLLKIYLDMLDPRTFTWPNPPFSNETAPPI
jgi:hypothetical protein